VPKDCTCICEAGGRYEYLYARDSDTGDIITKRCSKCEKRKALSDFHRCSNKLAGCVTSCAQCISGSDNYIALQESDTEADFSRSRKHSWRINSPV
jgi:hypothetical protein